MAVTFAIDESRETFEALLGGMKAFNRRATGVGGSQKFNVALRAIATTGIEGNGEPSLQRVLDLWQIANQVGDDTPDEYKLPLPPTTPNDEVNGPTSCEFAQCSRKSDC